MSQKKSVSKSKIKTCILNIHTFFKCKMKKNYEHVFVSSLTGDKKVQNIQKWAKKVKFSTLHLFSIHRAVHTKVEGSWL